MRRIFKTLHFNRWMRKTELTDHALCGAILEMVSGLIDADLGGGVMKRKSSSILDAMHETTRGLHKAGLISKQRMVEFDALCHLDVPEMAPQKTKSLRGQAQASQPAFAAVIHQ